MGWDDLPVVNAVLNGTSAVLLVAGYLCVRRKHIAAHRVCMLTAVAVSAVFLVCYIIHHARVGHVVFRGQGMARMVYLVILVSHTILAVAIVPLVLRTFWLALKGKLDRHKRLAHWTLPLWLYVSVTGVVVYWMLYRGPGRG